MITRHLRPHLRERKPYQSGPGSIPNLYCMLMIQAFPMLLKMSENITIIKRDIDFLNIWLQGNELSLNVVKTTQAIVIGSQPNLKKVSHTKVDTPSFSVGDSALDLVKNMRY